jgi:hypothetical protein
VRLSEVSFTKQVDYTLFDLLKEFNDFFVLEKLWIFQVLNVVFFFVVVFFKDHVTHDEVEHHGHKLSGFVAVG